MWSLSESGFSGLKRIFRMAGDRLLGVGWKSLRGMRGRAAGGEGYGMHESDSKVPALWSERFGVMVPKRRKAGQICQMGKGNFRRALVRIPTERTNSVCASRRAVFPGNSNRLPLLHRAWYTPSRLQVPRTVMVAVRSCLTLNS